MTAGRWIGAALSLAVLTVALPATAQDWTREDRARLLAPNGQTGPLCYDAVVVATQEAYANVESLVDLRGEAWLGARSDAYVKIRSVLRGHAPRGRVWIRLIETSAHQYGVDRVFVLRRTAEGRYWAVDWAYRDEVRRRRLLDPTTGWLPAPCAAKE